MQTMSKCTDIDLMWNWLSSRKNLLPFRLLSAWVPWWSNFKSQWGTDHLIRLLKRWWCLSVLTNFNLLLAEVAFQTVSNRNKLSRCHLTRCSTNYAVVQVRLNSSTSNSHLFYPERNNERCPIADKRTCL